MNWGGVDGVRQRLKLLLTVGAVCVATSLTFLAADPNATGYEITVYDSYPLVFWLLLFTAILVGQVVIFESGRLDDDHQYWRWGFALVISTTVVLLMIQALRYNLYVRGDMLSLIGMVRRIHALGVVPQSNYYPNVHLLSLTFTYVTGLRIPKAINVLTPLVSIFYFVSVYVLLDTLFTDRRKILFTLPFTALPLFKGQHVSFQPSWFAFLVVPFAFSLLFRGYYQRSRYPFKITLILIIVSLVFYHPAVTLFFTVVLIILKGAFSVGRRFAQQTPSVGGTPVLVASMTILLFFSWYYSFEVILALTLSAFYALLEMASGTSQFTNLSRTAARTDPQLLDLGLVGIHAYGLYAAVVSLGLVFVGFLTYLGLRRRREYDTTEVLLGVTLLVFVAGATVAFFVDIVLRFHRLLRFAIFSGSILIGIGFHTLYRRLGERSVVRYLRPVVYTSIFALAFLSVFTLYGSPLSNDPNLQMTKAEVEGMEWLFDHRNTSLVIDQLGIKQYRLYNFINPGTELGRNIRWRTPPPPAHFAYGNLSPETIKELPYTAGINRRYLVVTRLGRRKNPRFYPQYRQFWRHTPRDFRRLERNSSFYQIYDDGTLDAYIVRGIEMRTNESQSPA